MSDDNRANDVRALSRLNEGMKAGHIKLYRNLVGQPYVFCDMEGVPAVHLHLFARDFRGWLTLLVWENDHVLLREREVDRVLEALAGMSLREKTTNITDPELLRVIENEPVVAIVLEFMHGQRQRRFERSMESLWKTLKGFAKGRRLLVQGRNRYPGGANVLSRKLRLYSAVLERLGIKTTLQRSNGCRVVLERLDDPNDQSSGQSSVPNPQRGQDLPSMDGKASILANLREKQRRQESPRT